MNHTRRTSILIVLLGGLLVGCSADSSNQEQAETQETLNQVDIPKVDVHTHYYHARPYLQSMLEDWNMRAVVVDLFVDENSTRESWESALTVHENHPERIYLCTSFDPSSFNEPDFAEQTIGQLKTDINEHGAIMVKVWKNIGMVYKDEDGAYIQIDDPRFQPIWDFLKERDIPVLAHIGEPRAAWRPLDERSPHYTYYKNHPQYHNYKNSTVPEWTTIMEARDNWLEKNPELTVIGAHLGSMAYDTDEIAKRLDKYPNFYVDTAERFGDLAIQDNEKVRQFFIDYQDRILYGTDMMTGNPLTVTANEDVEREEELSRQRLNIHWQYLTGDQQMTFERTGTSFTAETMGLNLPREVIEKFYYENAERLLDL